MDRDENGKDKEIPLFYVDEEPPTPLWVSILVGALVGATVSITLDWLYSFFFT